MKTNDKYNTIIKPAIKVDGKCQPSIIVDVYDIERAFEQKSPPLRHALKKILCAGDRGHKDLLQDYKDIVTSFNKEILFIESEIERAV